MGPVWLEGFSGSPAKGLLNGNSQANTFASLDMLNYAPEAVPPSSTVVPDGVWKLHDTDGPVPFRLRLLPYGEGQVSAQFSVRVYGWQAISLPEGTPQQTVWIPHFIAEFLCTLCNRGGPPSDFPSQPSIRLIRETERMCDTISLTQGALGLTGFINSTGPGTDLIAFALLEVCGFSRISFDFSMVDQVSMPVSMNILWARA